MMDYAYIVLENAGMTAYMTGVESTASTAQQAITNAKCEVRWSCCWDLLHTFFYSFVFIKKLYYLYWITYFHTIEKKLTYINSYTVYISYCFSLPSGSSWNKNPRRIIHWRLSTYMPIPGILKQHNSLLRCKKRPETPQPKERSTQIIRKHLPIDFQSWLGLSYFALRVTLEERLYIYIYLWKYMSCLPIIYFVEYYELNTVLLFYMI